jgi:hypothetical protein
MPTSSEDLVKLEARTTETPHRSHHRSRQRKRLAAKIVLILALVIGGLAVGDFAYNAYRRALCLPAEETDESGAKTEAPPISEECGAEIAGRDDSLRLDAAGAVVAVVLLTGSILASRKLKPHRR